MGNDPIKFGRCMLFHECCGIQVFLAQVLPNCLSSEGMHFYASLCNELDLIIFFRSTDIAEGAVSCGRKSIERMQYDCRVFAETWKHSFGIDIRICWLGTARESQRWPFCTNFIPCLG